MTADKDETVVLLNNMKDRQQVALENSIREVEKAVSGLLTTVEVMKNSNELNEQLMTSRINRVKENLIQTGEALSDRTNNVEKSYGAVLDKLDKVMDIVTHNTKVVDDNARTIKTVKWFVAVVMAAVITTSVKIWMTGGK